MTSEVKSKVATVNFGNYKIPNIKVILELQAVVLESDNDPGPYNANSIGENPIGPVARAIANAVEDAVDIRIRDLPITAEKVYRAIIDHKPFSA